MSNIRVPEAMLPALGVLALKADKLPDFSDLQHTIGPELSFEGFRAAVADRSAVDGSDAYQMVRGLVNIAHQVEHTGKPLPQVLEEITTDLTSNAPESWRTKHLEAWKASLPLIEKAADPDGPFGILNKTIELTQAHQVMFDAAQIFTDIRPVFDSTASRIVRAVVTHMLTIRYTDADRHRRTMHYALDSADIAKLQKACARALTKVQTIKASVSSLPWYTDIVGEEEE